jgi:tetratricopeptide (TPR) repeat protein
MVVLLLLAAMLSAQGLPPLPTLALDTFPPAARDVLARAHKEAVKRPGDADAVGDLGRWLQAWELWDSADQAYRRAQALAPERFEWPYLDAVVMQRLARHDDAVALLRRAIAKNGSYLPARIKLAEGLFEAGDLAESRKLFEPLLKEPAAQPGAEVGLGRIAAQEGRHQAAVEHFERAVALFPELGAAYYGLARSYRALGRSDDAARALEQHRRYGARWPRVEDPVLASVAALREDPRAVLKRGVSFAEVGDVEKAIAEHEAALVGDPSLVNAHANLLSLYGRVKNFAKAEEHYRAAIAAGVSTADLHYDYGVIMAMQENWTVAEESYRRAIAANPLHAQAHNNLAGLLERRDVTAAVQEYSAAVAAQPQFRLARFNLGRMLLAQNKAAEAAAEFEKLREPRDAETPRYLFALATAYVRSGRREEGVKMAIEAQQLAKQHGQSDLAAAIARELAALK